VHIVLVEPEIPQNTGNIARSCAATGAELHLVHPLGFKLDESRIRRAGLDYWPLVKLQEHQSFAELLAKNPGGRFFYASTKAPRHYAEILYPEDAFLVFGKESKGLPEELLAANLDACVRIPMIGAARSLNLSNSVAILLYEALRQNGFPGLDGASERFL
jgi:tRNA (cytidine/uridine-2'-O-)-methyltransferase